MQSAAQILSALLLSFIALVSYGFTEEDMERLLEIGDEEFQVLAEPLRDPPFLHRKVLTVTEQSIETGWVKNFQCHGNFPKVSALQIVFRKGGVRKIQIVETLSIGKAWVEGPTVQLEDVGSESNICFLSENKIMERNPYNGVYRVTTGPFFYRFLDGYFPMRVDLTVRYPESKLRLWQVNPAAEPGIEVMERHGQVHLRSLFQGKLWAEFFFIQK